MVYHLKITEVPSRWAWYTYPVSAVVDLGHRNSGAENDENLM